MNPLSNLRLDYLIGADEYPNIVPKGRVVEVGFGALIKPTGPAIKYVNLFDENNTGRYGPYLKSTSTSRKYDEGVIDPSGAGWEKNLREQFKLAHEQGFEYVELDNPDAYEADDVDGAIDLAERYQLKVIAKNPLICADASYIEHPNVYGVVVEADAGSPQEHHELRRNLRDIPVWFVFFGSRKRTAQDCARQIRDENIPNMFVTYSSKGEYGSSADVT